VTGRSKDQDLIDELAARMQAPDPKTAQTNGHAGGTAAPPYKGSAASEAATDEDIIEKCRAAVNAAKFSDLYDHGDVHAHHGGDDSKADLALLGMLAFWTQDEAQLERLVSSSALGRREKWRRRDDYRKRTVRKALANLGETYDWPQEVGRGSLSSSPHTPGYSSDDDNNAEGKIVWFSELGEPKEREYLIEKIGVKGYPIVAFGAGGVAKSFAMLSAGVAIASASGVDDWLGLRVLEHGYVLYLDFELDAEEQHRRVRDLCAGMGIPIPKKLAYLSGVGISPDKAFSAARSFVDEYEAKAVIIDSMGLAMQGDMERGRDVLAFHGRYINPLRRAGVTPFIVDHEGKLQTGEKHKDKSPFGSAYKAWASRSVLQFELDEYDKEASALDIRVRQTKTNFGPKIEPIGVRFTFEEKKVEISTFDLPDEELIEEESKPVKERLVGALRIGPATNADLQRLTGASPGTIRNNLSHLIQAGTVVEDGYQGRSKVYSLLSSSPPPPRGNDSDDNNKPTVAELFAGPPPWLVTQLEAYRKDPERHIEPLCSAVAVVVLNDGARGTDVRDEVEKELERWEELR
jgi:hypothetical protein